MMYQYSFTAYVLLWCMVALPNPRVCNQYVGKDVFCGINPGGLAGMNNAPP